MNEPSLQQFHTLTSLNIRRANNFGKGHRYTADPMQWTQKVKPSPLGLKGVLAWARRQGHTLRNPYRDQGGKVFTGEFNEAYIWRVSLDPSNRVITVNFRPKTITHFPNSLPRQNVFTTRTGKNYTSQYWRWGRDRNGNTSFCND